MISEDDFIEFTPGVGALNYARDRAVHAEIGGVSYVHQTKEQRQQNLKGDQVIGQIGCLVGNWYLTGDCASYKRSRDIADANPRVGDGGSDVPGRYIDFKASKVRTNNLYLDYHLLVRPAERHDGHCYILILVDDLNTQSARVTLIGMASTAMLPENPDTEGRFRGTHVLPAR